MAEVRLVGVRKDYGQVTAVHDINLHVKDKEFVVLVGPSGCGKSTTLRMIAGLEEISAGQLLIDERMVNSVAPKDRDIAMVFQNYALYPHMTVFQNMAFGLKIKGLAKAEIEKRVNEAATIVDLLPFLKRKPGTLSGGQRQRVALGRAIVRNPKVFLFDEPLSNLDAKLRVQMRIEISRLQRKLGVTTIYVTHDQTEAMTMADRIAILKDGVLQQFATPMETYHHPANTFVAGFIGSPSMNLIQGHLSEDMIFTDDAKSLQIPLADFVHTDIPSGSCILGIRPEDIHGDNGLSIKTYHPVSMLAEAVEPLGSDSFLYGRSGTQDLIARIRPEIRIRLQEMNELYIDRSRIHLFDAETGTNLSSRNSTFSAG